MTQDKPQFWKRKPSIVKCNMLLLAHLSRAPVPPIFDSDMKFVLKKVLHTFPVQLCYICSNSILANRI